MATCNDLITTAIQGKCGAHENGFDAMGVIFNREDINTLGTTFSDGVIEKLVRKENKAGFAIYQPRKKAFNGTQIQMQEGDYEDTFTKTVKVLVPLFADGDHTTDCAQKQALMRGDFVLFLLSKPVPNEMRSIHVFGFENGLKCTAAEKVFYNDSTLGMWDLTLTEKNAYFPDVYYEPEVTDTEELFKDLLVV